MEQKQVEQPQIAPAKLEVEDGKMSKKGLIGMIVLTIIALAGVAFGVFGMVQSSDKDKEISDLKVQIKEIGGKIAEFTTDKITTVDEDGNLTEITDTNVETEPDVNIKSYLYVPEWGLKIEKPEGLKTVSYKFAHGEGYTKVVLWGVDCSNNQCQYFPDFANSDKNSAGLSIIGRYPKGKEFSPASAPILIFSDDEYDYYGFHPQVAYGVDSGNEVEIQWEVDTTTMIWDMLTNPDNYSKI